MHIAGNWIQPLASSFHAMDEEHAFGLERAQLPHVAEPSASVDFRRRGWINDSLVRHFRKSRGAKQFGPFLGRQETRGYRKETSPLVAMRIVAIVVDQDPYRAAIAEYTENIFGACRGIGPVIR